MKEFDLQKAKAGAPVCTRDGNKVRIICFDRKGKYPIVALVNFGNAEEAYVYTEKGKFYLEHFNSNLDLIMADIPTIYHEGWMNIRYNFDDRDVANYHIYNSKEDAENDCPDDFHTVKIVWEDAK